MKVSFNIHFHTLWGQSLYVVGSIPELGSGSSGKAVLMNYQNNGIWQVEIELPNKTKTFEYSYFLKFNDEIIFEEWAKVKHTFKTTGNDSYFLFDHWQEIPHDTNFYSSAFTKSLFSHSTINEPQKGDTIIKVWAPRLEKNQRLALLGNQNCWSNWEKPQWLTSTNAPEWEICFERDQLQYPVEYKFCIFDGDKQIWEEGSNRHLDLSSLKEETYIVSGLQFRSTSFAWKCAGISIPVFSLRSNNSFGIGDFIDLMLMVDWAVNTGQKIIQILPINDTTMLRNWMDSYPYNAISIYALHPLYLRLDYVGKIEDKQSAQFYCNKQKELNNLPAIDFDQVCTIKWKYLQEIYEQEGEATINSKKFKLFFKENKSWLVPYAAYSYLRDAHQSADFSSWGEYATYNKRGIDKLIAQKNKEIGFYYFIQYHLDLQLSEVRDYAHSKEVVLKGDIPIGVNKMSVDAWIEPQYFNMNYQAGAPPDDFSVNGQNWGFPTYNWEAMENDNYLWWKKRFFHMSHYFDAYRIDHILGFFRIWEIPQESTEGLLGYFYPSLPYSLEEIEQTGMKFQKDMCEASVREDHLSAIFDEYTTEVKQTYLDRKDASTFVLKEKFNSQRKIENYFREKDTKSQVISKGLKTLCGEILFIEDKEKKNYYHPRISANHTYIYKDLVIQDRNAFDFLYWDYYYNRQNDFWKEQALKKLRPLINSTSMLACGEDLGMIPSSVPEVMNCLQILSLEIERMPKSPHVEFAKLSTLPYLSVCTTSTHDMSTIRGWWKEDQEKTQRYYNQVLMREGLAPIDCTTDICRQILENHLQSNSIFCIIPFQDWLSIDDRLRSVNVEEERINVPSNPRHYWRYRMHLTIEQLLMESSFNEEVRRMTKR
ncbi:4-alpha-glucanotransferase [Bacteroidales bacterium OttesenSCG-928-M11]|nr:4-alpha-glucanotransferase [Bacteroidales bacterium OttesenSCG-928-M11]